MIKKNLKYLISIMLVISLLISFSTCFADETEESNDELVTTTLAAENASSEPEEQEIHKDDLYLFDTDVTMDKLVDGNVFIVGNNVKITGKVNGNLFVLASKTVSFEEDSYISHSCFVFAPTITYNGACTDFYSLSTNLESTYDSYFMRDLKAISSNMTLKSAVGRNANLLVSNPLNLGDGEDIAAIYGNLNYTSQHEVEVPDTILVGEESKVNFSKLEPKKEDKKINFSSIISNLLVLVVTCLIIALVVKFLLPSVNTKISEFSYSPSNIIECFGIGLLVLIVSIIVIFALLLSTIGLKLCILLILAFVFICMVSIPLFIISIADILKTKLNVEKDYMSYLLIVAVSIAFYLITLIPILGAFIKFIVTAIVFGLYFKTLINKSDNKKVSKKETKEIIEEVTEEKKDNEVSEELKNDEEKNDTDVNDENK